MCVFQVERRVVSQLALAHERRLISKGSSIRITVENVNEDSELTKSVQSEATNSSSNGGKVPTH